MQTTLATVPAASVAAEIDRLKTPDLGAGQPPWPLIGFRIQEEKRRQNEWIVANLTREQRRKLTRNSTFGLHYFWENEPPLSVDTWDELLAQFAERIVVCRIEAGCPAFPVYMSPRPISEHKWPPVKIHPYSVADELSAGAAKLTEFAAEIAQAQADMRSAMRLVKKAQGSPSLLSEPGFRARWETAITRVEELGDCFKDDRESSLGFDAADKLLTASEHRRLVTGGGWSDPGSQAYAVPVELIKKEIYRSGLANDSLPL